MEAKRFIKIKIGYDLFIIITDLNNYEIYLKNNDILVIKPKSKIEKLDLFTDNYPCLSLRKSLMKIKLYHPFSSLLIFRFISSYCFKIISTTAFEYIFLAVILFNSVILALNDDGSKFFRVTDTFFNVAYFLEFFLKVFGLGFVMNKNSYLRDSWNILDFVIII